MAPRANGDPRHRPGRRNRPAPEGLELRRLLSGAFPAAIPIPKSPPGHTFELQSLIGDDGSDTTSHAEFSGPVISASEKAAALAADGTYQFQGVAIGPGAFIHESANNVNFQIVDATNSTVLTTPPMTDRVIGDLVVQGDQRKLAFTIHLPASALAQDGVHLFKLLLTNSAFSPPITSTAYPFLVDVDTTPPAVANVTSPTPGRTFGAGDTVPIVVNFGETIDYTAVASQPAPTLLLGTGPQQRVATFAGAGVNSLTFNYVVQPGDLANPLNYASVSALDLHGNRLQDAAGNPASLTLPPPTDAVNSLAAANLIVDTSLKPGAPPVLLTSDDTGSGQSDHVTSRTTDLHFIGKAADDITLVTVDLFRRNPDGSSDTSNGPLATATGVPNATHDYGMTLAGPIPPGLYNVVAAFSDRDGNQSPATAPMAPPLKIDTSPPVTVAATAIGPGTLAQGVFLTTSPTPTVRGVVGADNDDSPSALTITLRSKATGEILSTVTPDAAGNWAIPLSKGQLSEGAHDFLVTASDPAGNVVAATITIILDTKKPTIDAGSIALSDRDPQSLDLPTQVTTSTSPTITFAITDQTYSGRTNALGIEVVDATDGTLLAQGIAAIAPGADNASGSVSARLKLEGLQPGPHAIQIWVADSAGNVGSLGSKTFSFNVFTAAAPATMGAPGTPVHTTVYDIAQSLLNNGTFAADGDLKPGAALLSPAVFPWTIGFDRTTQTIWVDLRGGDTALGPTGFGDRVMQVDPATGTYKLYDLQSPSFLDQHKDYELTASTPGSSTGSTPHGIFFDFESHLTPRVWFTQEHGGKFSYIDVARNQLVSYDIRKILDDNGYTDPEGDPAQAGLHAVTVDLRGVVWISDQPDNLILELDPRNGDSVDNATATLTVHKIPPQFIPEMTPLVSTEGEHLGPHGIDTVVDDTNGQATVYISMLGNGHILRLIPGDQPGAVDQWTDYDTSTLMGVGDPKSGSSLFPVIDNLETPLDPDDDRIYWGDVGGGGQAGQASSKNLIRALDPNTGTVTTWAVTPIPGAPAVAQPNQVYIDREGNVFYIDRQSGVGRLDPSARATRVFVETKAATMTVQDNTPRSPIALDQPVIYDFGTIPSQHLAVVPVKAPTQANRSTSAGLNQYDVRSINDSSGRGQGPFRGALSAGSNLYASLTQNDQVSVTTFAETARRQMSVVNDPGTPDAPGTGRMAFQVLRDGSLVMTGRQTPSIGDQQINLTRAINGPRFFGDVSAVTDGSGITHVFGRDLDTGGITQYIYNPHATQPWTFQRLPAVKDALPGLKDDVLAANPTAFLESARGVGVMVTTSSGHLLVYYPSLSTMPTDLTAFPAAGLVVYSSVGAIEASGRVYAYGTDQKGDLVEYSYDVSVGPASTTARIVPDVPAVYQDVEVVADGDTRHVFATDGNSQLVHVELAPGRAPVGENVTLELDKGPGPQIIGYADYQRPYAGRVYSELTALVDPLTHDLYVYGTNGRDLIQFLRPSGGSWQVVDLTNNVAGDPNVAFMPANKVLGAPAAYILPDGSKHILQINEEGEVVEFYQLGRGSIFSTLDINLAAGAVAATPAPSGPSTINLPAGQTRRVGPNATPLVPTDAAATSFLGVGVLQNTRDRASFRFVATHSGPGVFDLRAPFSILELDAYNRRGRLIQRNRDAVKVTDAPGNSYYQNQVVLDVVAGQAYGFLVRGTSQRRHRQVPGFGNFTLLARYLQVADDPVATLAAPGVSNVPHGPMRGRFHRVHRAGVAGARWRRGR